MVDVSPEQVEIVDEGGDVWSLWADGRRVGYMASTGAAKWWQAAHRIIPMLIAALEETLTARDLVMVALQGQSVKVAGEVSLRARVPMYATDWTPPVAAQAARYLAEQEESGGEEPF